MLFPGNFIAATTEYTELDRPVPAPYLRRSFTLEQRVVKAEMLIGAAGFYELYVNGQRITRGALSPFINNPDDIVYYDRYDLASLLTPGENVIGLCLGNGLQNNPGGYSWDFDKARWRGAPRVALQVDIIYSDHTTLTIDSREGFRCADSPTRFDDLRRGEHYDARYEFPGWERQGFDDSEWKPALKAESPRGERRLCEAPPILVNKEVHPVAIVNLGDGYLYDFGANYTGVCRLNVEGREGQKIVLTHGELLKDGRLDTSNLCCDPKGFNQKDVYICSGTGIQTWQPQFTYHGFQYVFVQGLDADQATSDALICVVMNTALEERGGFSCSDATANKLQAMTRQSTLGNFHHFLTDCPHREKNGWTADIALSSEHVLLNLDAGISFREWMRSVYKAQANDGSLPGIIPTGGWGFEWGNGPAWDCVLLYVPYFTYLYCGDRIILEESAPSIMRYLSYLTTKVREDGLLCLGLGDWCPPGRVAHDYKSPLEFTTTVISMDICEKAAFIFDTLGMKLQSDFAQAFYIKLRKAARERLIDWGTMTALGDCQTSQAMAIYYNVFDPGEKAAAFSRLLDIVHNCDDHLDAGVLGARVLFHVLASFDETDLAFRMITQPTYPSYGWWVAQGATSLWEDFLPMPFGSRNHHFWGDISHFFIRHLAGIHYNPYRTGGCVNICPKFVSELKYAEGFHIAPEGEIRVRWEREENSINLSATVPESLKGNIVLPPGYMFDNGNAVKNVTSGQSIIISKNCVSKL